ncbi:MAG: hypothetical protein VW175_05535, partial [Alphaproteobacteria bacterium]
GQGRDEAIRAEVTEALYSAAEDWLRSRIGETPFALSLEIMEIDARFAERRFNSLHAFLKAKDGSGG